MQSIQALVKAQSRGAIRNSIKSSVRPFCSTYACQNRASKAPSTRRQSLPPNSQARGNLRSQRQEWIGALNENLKPTLGQFKLAKTAGALKIDPEEAIQLLRSFCNDVKEPGWEARFCREHSIDPPTLGLIGRIVLKSYAEPIKRMGGKILICAAMLGDLNSIVVVLSKALQNDEIHLPDLLVPMTKLQFYAKQGNAEAMVMYGRILDHQRRHSEAMEMFRRVAETPRDGSIDAEIGNSIVQQGNICNRDGKRDDARAHFKKAALEFDNPEGYYKLALLMPDQDPLKETYLLKAASSRIREAVIGVADLYTRMAQLHASSEKGQEASILAKEWLKLASRQGHRSSELRPDLADAR